MSEELTPPRFPTMLRKMWSGGEVQAWIDENWNRRAQPAAPADAAPSVAPEPVAWQERQEVERGVFGDWYTTNSGWSTLRPPEVLSGGIRYQFRPLYAHPPRAPLTEEIESADKLLRHLGLDPERCRTEGGSLNVSRIKTLLAAAAPSVAPEPVAWTTLIEIDWVKRNAGRAGSFYAVKAGPNDIPLFAHPPRAPLTEEHVTAVVRSVCPNLAETSKAWRDLVVECRYWLEAANGIGGK